MHRHPPCPTDEFLWTIAAARLVLPTDVHLQAPPNLSDDLGPLVGGGDRRLGRRVPGYGRPREPRAGVAGPRDPAGRHRGGRARARPAAHPLPRVRPRPGHVARPGPPVPGARRIRRRGPGPRPPLGLGGRVPAARAPAPRGGAVTTHPSRGGHPGLDRRGGGRGADRRAGRAGGGRGRDRDPVRRPWPRGPGRLRGRRPAPLRHRGRRGHLRGQPEHQLHQRLHLQVQVLRLLQRTPVAQPAGHARTSSS